MKTPKIHIPTNEEIIDITKLVDGPDHYNGYEVLEMICNAGFGEGFCLGNVIKYVARCKKKGEYEKDLKKGQFYMNWWMKELEKGEQK